MSGAFDNEMGRAQPIDPPPPATLAALRNPDAELYLLSELVADNRLIDRAADHLRAADFGVVIHARVFALMLREAAAGRSVEAVTLDPYLKDDEDWQAVFNHLSAADLNAVRDHHRTKGYIDHILELSRRRRLVAGMLDAVAAARTLETPISEIIINADEAIAEVADTEGGQDQATAGEYADIAIESFGKPIEGVKSGIIRSLDDITGTLRYGDQIVMAAGTGMGKTAVASSYAIGAAESGKGVLFVSQEMSGDQLARRMLADMTHRMGNPVLHSLIRDGEVPGEQMRYIIRARDRLHELPIEMLDISGLTLAKLRRRIRKQKRRFAARDQRLDLVIIDYLQLMQGSRADLTPYQRVNEISTGLKQLAREERVVMLSLAQLNRSYEKRPSRRPEKSDLRDSGQIEQDADCIILLHREEAFLKMEEPPRHSLEHDGWASKMDNARGVIEFLCPKVRSGEAGKALGWFHAEYQAVRGGSVVNGGHGG